MKLDCPYRKKQVKTDSILNDKLNNKSNKWQIKWSQTVSAKIKSPRKYLQTKCVLLYILFSWEGRTGEEFHLFFLMLIFFICGILYFYLRTKCILLYILSSWERRTLVENFIYFFIFHQRNFDIFYWQTKCILLYILSSWEGRTLVENFISFLRLVIHQIINCLW